MKQFLNQPVGFSNEINIFDGVVGIFFERVFFETDGEEVEGPVNAVRYGLLGGEILDLIQGDGGGNRLPLLVQVFLDGPASCAPGTDPGSVPGCQLSGNYDRE